MLADGGWFQTCALQDSVCQPRAAAEPWHTSGTTEHVSGNVTVTPCWTAPRGLCAGRWGAGGGQCCLSSRTQPDARAISGPASHVSHPVEGLRPDQPRGHPCRHPGPLPFAFSPSFRKCSDATGCRERPHGHQPPRYHFLPLEIEQEVPAGDPGPRHGPTVWRTAADNSLLGPGGHSLGCGACGRDLASLL